MIKVTRQFLAPKAITLDIIIDIASLRSPSRHIYVEPQLKTHLCGFWNTFLETSKWCCKTSRNVRYILHSCNYSCRLLIVEESQHVDICSIFNQVHLYKWTEHFHLIFLNLKLIQILYQNFFSYLSTKVMTFDKIWGLKLKN